MTMRRSAAIGKLRSEEIKVKNLRVGGDPLNDKDTPVLLFPLFDNRLYHGEFIDFIQPDDNFTLNTIEAGTGNATEALTNVAGGEILVTNAAGDNDADQLTRPNETYLMATGKELWFEAKVKISDATQSDFVIGLIATENLTAVADSLPGDGVGFVKDDGATDIDTFSSQNGTNEENAAVGTMATAYITYAFYYDGKGTISYFIAGKLVGTATTTINDDEPMAITAMIRNGEAVAKTMTIDYIHVVQAR